MKSVQWTLRVLMVVVSMTTVACSKGGGKSRNGQTTFNHNQRRPQVPQIPNGGQQQLQQQLQQNANGGQRTMLADASSAMGTRSDASPAVAGSLQMRPTVPAGNTLSATATTQAGSSERVVVPARAPIPDFGSPATNTRVYTGSGSDSSSGSSEGSPAFTKVEPSAPASVYEVQGSSSGSSGFIEIPVAQAAPTSSGVVITDTRAGNQGPGWSRGDQTSQQPIYSGLINPKGQAYTDGKDDGIMAVLVEKMNQTEANIRQDSEQLAMTVNRLDLAVDRGVIALDLGFKFSDKQVDVAFSGFLKPGEGAATLTQRSGTEQFMVHVTCADQQGQQAVKCRNAILAIFHLKDGVICRRIYAVHRWMIDGVGDGHLTMSNEEVELSTKIYEEDRAIRQAQRYNTKYDKVSVVKNRAYRAFLRLAGNTVHFNRRQNGEYQRMAVGDNNLPRDPRFNFIGVRSWTVAYGTSFFEITMGRGKAGQRLIQEDTTLFSGLLLKPRVPGEVATRMSLEGNYKLAQVDDRYDERFANNIRQADLIDNDGRGHLTLKMNFHDPKEAPVTSRLNFTSQYVNTLSVNDLLKIVP